MNWVLPIYLKRDPTRELPGSKTGAADSEFELLFQTNARHQKKRDLYYCKVSTPNESTNTDQ